MVINTGNANAGTGADRLARARLTCDAAAGLLGVKAIVTIAGDTSTNDSFVLVATQKAGHAPITGLPSADDRALAAALPAAPCCRRRASARRRLPLVRA